MSFPVTAGLFTFLYFTSKHLKSLFSIAILLSVVGCQGQYPSVQLQIISDFQNCVYAFINTLLLPCLLSGGLHKLSSIMNESIDALIISGRA